MRIGRGNRSHMTWPGLVPGPPRWVAGDHPPELWHGLLVLLMYHEVLTPLSKTKNSTLLSRNSKTNATRTSQNYVTCPKSALFRFWSNGISVNAQSNVTLSKKRDGSRQNDTGLSSLPQTVGNNGTCEDIDCGRPGMCRGYLFPTPNSQFQQPVYKKIIRYIA
jgi:hypothetical protein